MKSNLELNYFIIRASIYYFKNFSAILFCFKLENVVFCRWLDVDEDDGAIVREITAGGSQMLSSKLLILQKIGLFCNYQISANSNFENFAIF